MLQEIALAVASIVGKARARSAIATTADGAGNPGSRVGFTASAAVLTCATTDVIAANASNDALSRLASWDAA
jgi:hypothetical protein